MRRTLAVVAAPLIAIAISLFAFGGTASAHEVTSITADCDRVTVQFSGFPEAGVTVHIAVAVSGHALIASDVLVTSATFEAHVDISAATATLSGASANVDVDVTWTLDGLQHVHKTLTVTCGSATTTTTTIAPTTSTTAPTTSTTGTNVTSTTVNTETTTTTAPTSITVAGVTTSTAVRNAAVSGSTTIPVSGLPRTGGSTTPLLGVALALAVVGATAIGATTRRRTHS